MDFLVEFEIVPKWTFYHDIYILFFLSDKSLSGEMQAKAETVDSSSAGVRRRTGPAFLENRGFGWLMEVQDDDEDFQKPLLWVVTLKLDMCFFLFCFFIFWVNYWS